MKCCVGSARVAAVASNGTNPTNIFGQKVPSGTKSTSDDGWSGPAWWPGPPFPGRAYERLSISSCKSPMTMASCWMRCLSNLALKVGPLGVVCECHGPHSWPLVHSKPEPLEPVLDSRALHEVRGWHYGAAWRGVAIDAALSPSPVEVTRNSMPRLPTTLGNDCHRWRGPPCSLMG